MAMDGSGTCAAATGTAAATPDAPISNVSQQHQPLKVITSLASPEMSEETSDEADDVTSGRSHLTDEDAESLIGVSMSHAASRLKSPSTPAIEKRNALEDGGRYLGGGEDFPTVDEAGPEEEQEEQEEPTRPIAPALELTPSIVVGRPPPPASKPLGPASYPTKPSDSPQSSLHGVFGGLDRKRSLSGSADALRRLLPKNLPSMSQVGSIFASSSTRLEGSLGSLAVSKVPGHARTRSALTPAVESALTARPVEPQGTKLLRHSTSDDNLLYHTLSRASSLGDDTRFENQHDQVNSRVKAIRDSLYDRTSFRLPQMPSMPSMPNFSFSMNFLNPYSVPPRFSSDADVLPDLLPSTGTKKRSSTIPVSHTVLPGITAVATSKPDVPQDLVRHGSEVTHPLDHVLESLTGDVVIMGGYRGSILRSTATHRQVWVPMKIGLNIRKVNLEVGLEPEDEERMHESIYASGMLQNIGPVDISKRLFKRLSECENARNGKLRVWDYGYDWRLSPHLLSKRLAAFLEGLPSNRAGAGPDRGALVIAHSLGGVIARHVVNSRPELFSGVVYAGVPQSCVNILGPIRNGDAVLLSSRVLTAQVNFTLRTSFVLLPEDGSCFVDINTREKYPVDFFNLDHWIKYRFSPCTDPPLPPRNFSAGSLRNLINQSSSLLNLSLPGRKPTSASSFPSTPSSLSADEDNSDTHQTSTTSRAVNALREKDLGKNRPLAPQLDRTSNPVHKVQNTNSSVSTAVTIPRDKAIAYLKRTLAETKKYKEELHFRPELEKRNQYPPLSVIYGKSIPTCCGAKVDGWEGIPCSDSYDNLAFASGDGVVLAKEAMLPDGYKMAYGGRVKSDRGHVTLLGDLHAVGKAIDAVWKLRARGVGLGLRHDTS